MMVASRAAAGSSGGGGNQANLAALAKTGKKRPLTMDEYFKRTEVGLVLGLEAW